MAEFILNPRRTPRAAVRCEARIALKEGGFWASPTSDYGPRGCKVLAPVQLEPGSRVFVELVNERIDAPVSLAGHVAWTAREAPWRTGIAFDNGSEPAASGFFDQLTAAYPGIDTYGHAPDRIPGDAPLAPAAPPPFEPQLTDRWEPGVHALFSLLGRRYVVVGAPDPAAAAGWTALRAQRT